MLRIFIIFFFTFCSLTSLWAATDDLYNDVDTVLYLESVDVSVVKQGTDIKQQAISTSLIGRLAIDARGVSDLKELTQMTPNVYIPDYGSRTTSSIYVRGLGARIDNPVVGLNIDNVPIMNKDNFDFEMADIERIEVLRGPQSAMYGRNTMAGVINVYTISPFNYQGIRAGLEYGSGNAAKARLGVYGRSDNSNFAYSISGYYTRKDGLWTNEYNGEDLDWERLGGGRLGLHWRAKNYSIDNTFSFSILEQGGYPYQQLGSTGVNYNDECSFERTNLTNGLTIAREFEKFKLSSITSYQYTDNRLDMDNDFTAYDYFTLVQAVEEHTITQDVIFSSKEAKNGYSWLVGAFGFAESSQMSAPVNFKSYGIDNLIIANANEYNPQYYYVWLDDELLFESDFDIPTYGLSLYHKSELETGRWKLSAQLRVDYEYTRLNYSNFVDTDYRAVNKDDEDIIYDIPIKIDNDDFVEQNFFELLPKLSASYSLDRGMLYASFAKGYKSGGFNTQMFSDVLQQQLMNEMGVGLRVSVDDIVTYKPEYSWNYELGGKFSWREKGLEASFALFYIDCRDQQLTVFPDEMITGRMMTNAGKTRSYGAEFSVLKTINNLTLAADYGYTNAKFVEYNDGEYDYSGNYVPYSPMNTVSVRADYRLNIANGTDLVFGCSARGVGDIYWDESNSIVQPFYGLLDARIAFEKPKYSITLSGKNLLNQDYNTFYFESINNQFVQKGNPRTFAISINLNI